MELKDLRTKTVGELHKLLAETREKLREINFNTAAKQLKNVASRRTTRREVARILTVIREKRNK